MIVPFASASERRRRQRKVMSERRGPSTTRGPAVGKRGAFVPRGNGSRDDKSEASTTPAGHTTGASVSRGYGSQADKSGDLDVSISSTSSLSLLERARSFAPARSFNSSDGKLLLDFPSEKRRSGNIDGVACARRTGRS